MLRDYQARAVDAVVSALLQGERVCLVAPTGAGKTVMMCAVAAALDMRTVWVTHRDALIDQSAAALERSGLSTGIYSAGRRDGLDAQVVVASWQTVVARGEAPPAELLLIDEAHHVQGKKWRTILDHYQNARLVGATATPQRGDGRPLGDVFSKLVVAAQYSELLQQGHLTPCRVFCPPEDISPNLARHPLVAYQAKCPGTKAIGFAASIELAKEYAEEFNHAGFPSRVISQRTKPAERVETIAAFKRGQIKALWSVQVLTEGFDCPDAETCIIARGCQHSGTFLQMVGRVLRYAPGKSTAYLLDLSGVCNTHALPTCDRAYSLEGRAIQAVSPLRQCRKCGLVWEPPATLCPECGWSVPQVMRAAPEITGDELIERAQSEAMARREYPRLREIQKTKGLSFEWLQTQVRKLYGAELLISDASDAEQRRELNRLRQKAKENGYKPAYANVRFKAIFGSWPGFATGGGRPATGSLYWTKSGWRGRIRVEVDGETTHKSYDLETADRSEAEKKIAEIAAQYRRQWPTVETQPREHTPRSDIEPIPREPGQGGRPVKGSLYWTKSGWRGRIRTVRGGPQKNFDLETDDRAQAEARLREVLLKHIGDSGAGNV